MNSSIVPPNASIQSSTRWWKSALPWILAGAAAVPVSILVHELGHHFFAVAFGFQGATLHYFSATYTLEQSMLDFMARGDRAGVASILPLWKIALNAAAGPGIEYFLILPVCLLAAKFTPNPFVIALGVMPFLRAFPEMMIALSAPTLLDDENTAAFAMGLPASSLHLVGFFISLAAAFWLVRRIPPEKMRAALISMAIGVLAGAVVYLGFLGPWLLP